MSVQTPTCIPKAKVLCATRIRIANSWLLLRSGILKYAVYKINVVVVVVVFLLPRINLNDFIMFIS